MELDDILMPFSAVATVDPEMSRNELFWEEGHRNYPGNLGDVRLAVPEGVAAATVSWDGPKELTVQLKNTSAPTEKLATIPAGGGERLYTTIPAIPALPGAYIYLYYPRPADTTGTATITIIPISPPS